MILGETVPSTDAGDEVMPLQPESLAIALPADHVALGEFEVAEIAADIGVVAVRIRPQIGMRFRVDLVGRQRGLAIEQLRHLAVDLASPRRQSLLPPVEVELGRVGQPFRLHPHRRDGVQPPQRKRLPDLDGKAEILPLRRGASTQQPGDKRALLGNHREPGIVGAQPIAAARARADQERPRPRSLAARHLVMARLRIDAQQQCNDSVVVPERGNQNPASLVQNRRAQRVAARHVQNRADDRPALEVDDMQVSRVRGVIKQEID
ncbi:hypothetical protein H8A97_16130 [Bradyrhizobium sp. Arg62]|uniref:hypothetical protein n=1 Tax=Bradyrhizobium brasilense TaxID=1419277 RepID=UPI001E36338B|nr:hypothetical protein [Bradyrhizobium brasilense]MCC8946596.1 hypothetical protein [Bradyrhizobium brasilense]